MQERNAATAASVDASTAATLAQTAATTAEAAAGSTSAVGRQEFAGVGEFAAEAQRRAALEIDVRGRKPRTLDEKARTVELTWTTGAPVQRGGMMPTGEWGYYIEELGLDPRHVDLSRLRSGTAPLLNSHRADTVADVIGKVIAASVDGERGAATVVFSDRAEVEPIFRDVAAGILGNISVGYVVSKWQETTADGDTVRRFRAVRWQPMELSLVPIPADAGAQVRAAGAPTSIPATQQGTATMQTRTAAQAAADTVPAAAAPVVDETAIRTAAADEAKRLLEAERKRSADILGIARRHGLGDELAQRHIEEGTTLEVFRAAVLDQLAERAPVISPVSQVQLVADERDKYLRAAESAILARAGVAGMVTAHGASLERDGNRKAGEFKLVDPGECRGLTLVDMARDCLERAGVRTRGMDRREIVGKALTMRSAGFYQSVSDFAVLLETTMYKTLQAAYGTQPVIWPRLCRRGTVTDFRTNTRYRRGLLGTLLAKSANGEFQRLAIPDGEKSTITAGTKGFIIGLSREAIINDDMGAFSDLATDAGRAAAVTVEVDVFALLALNTNGGPTMSDSTAMFHANHGNLAASGAIPSVATFDAVRVAMKSQKDPAGNDFIIVDPFVWVGPPKWESTARIVNGATYDPDTANKLQRPNAVTAMLSDIVSSPRISGDQWYVFANPAIQAAIEVAFLEGEAAPYLEAQMGWTVDGTEWKVRLDYGVAGIDYRAGYRNPGAAS